MEASRRLPCRLQQSSTGQPQPLPLVCSPARPSGNLLARLRKDDHVPGSRAVLRTELWQHYLVVYRINPCCIYGHPTNLSGRSIECLLQLPSRPNRSPYFTTCSLPSITGRSTYHRRGQSVSPVAVGINVIWISRTVLGRGEGREGEEGRFVAMKQARYSVGTVEAGQPV